MEHHSVINTHAKYKKAGPSGVLLKHKNENSDEFQVLILQFHHHEYFAQLIITFIIVGEQRFVFIFMLVLDHGLAFLLTMA